MTLARRHSNNSQFFITFAMPSASRSWPKRGCSLGVFLSVSFYLVSFCGCRFSIFGILFYRVVLSSHKNGTAREVIGVIGSKTRCLIGHTILPTLAYRTGPLPQGPKLLIKLDTRPVPQPIPQTRNRNKP